MYSTYNTLFTILIFAALSIPSLFGQEAIGVIKGVYGSPKALWDKGYTLQNLGVNSIFVHSGSLTPEVVERAKSENAYVFAEFATLNGKNYVDKHPEAWAINEKGEKVEAASWFMGVCPTEPGFRKYRMDQLRRLLTDYDLDGVWMDYVHWHAQFEDLEPILPETCFNDSCLASFSKDTGVQIPMGTRTEKAAWILRNVVEKWRDWRCNVIYDWAKEMKDELNRLRPGALLGLYHCPWTDAEFNNARQRILGLDYSLLKKTVDVFSPMVYHERMGRKATWVAENVIWLGEKLDVQENGYPKIWPIVQAHNDPGMVSPSEFVTVLKGGLAGKSTGVMMFTTNAVAGDEEKAEVMKTLYHALDTIRQPN